QHPPAQNQSRLRIRPPAGDDLHLPDPALMNEGVASVRTANADMDVVTIGKVIHDDTFAFRPVLGSDYCQNVTLELPHGHALLDLVVIRAAGYFSSPVHSVICPQDGPYLISTF